MSRTWHHGDKAKKHHFGDAWRWLSQTPGWWNTLFHHKPARQKTRAKLRRGDEENYPNHKKPHKYYW